MTRRILSKEFVPEAIKELIKPRRVKNAWLDEVAGTLLGNNYVGFRVDPEIRLALSVIKAHTGKGPHEFFRQSIIDALAEKNEQLLERCIDALKEWEVSGEYVTAKDVRKMTGFPKSKFGVLQKTLGMPKPTMFAGKEVWRREDIYNWHKKHESD